MLVETEKKNRSWLVTDQVKLEGVTKNDTIIKCCNWDVLFDVILWLSPDRLKLIHSFRPIRLWIRSLISNENTYKTTRCIEVAFDYSYDMLMNLNVLFISSFSLSQMASNGIHFCSDFKKKKKHHLIPIFIYDVQSITTHLVWMC